MSLTITISTCCPKLTIYCQYEYVIILVPFLQLIFFDFIFILSLAKIYLTNLCFILTSFTTIILLYEVFMSVCKSDKPLNTCLHVSYFISLKYTTVKTVIQIYVL